MDRSAPIWPHRNAPHSRGASRAGARLVVVSCRQRSAAPVAARAACKDPEGGPTWVEVHAVGSPTKGLDVAKPRGGEMQPVRQRTAQCGQGAGSGSNMLTAQQPA